MYPVEDGGALAYVQPSWDDAEFIAHARTDIRALLADNERLRARLTVDDAMIERGARAFYEHQFGFRPNWDRLTKASPDVADKYRRHMTAALNAALNPGEGS